MKITKCTHHCNAIFSPTILVIVTRGWNRRYQSMSGCPISGWRNVQQKKETVVQTKNHYESIRSWKFGFSNPRVSTYWYLLLVHIVQMSAIQLHCVLHWSRDWNPQWTISMLVNNAWFILTQGKSCLKTKSDNISNHSDCLDLFNWSHSDYSILAWPISSGIIHISNAELMNRTTRFHYQVPKFLYL